MCRALLRIFAILQEYSHTVEVCKKIPSLGTRCKTSYGCAGTIPTNVRIIFTSVGIILTHVGTIPTLGGITPTLYIMCRNLSYKI